MESKENFKFFNKNKDKFLQDGRVGKFALLKDKKVIQWFDTFNDAIETGKRQFGEGEFSVQELKKIDNIANLGFFSYV